MGGRGAAAAGAAGAGGGGCSPESLQQFPALSPGCFFFPFHFTLRIYGCYVFFFPFKNVVHVS